MIKKVKNLDSVSRTWVGQEIGPSAYYEIRIQEERQWTQSDKLATDILNGDAAINDGVSDLYGATAVDYLKREVMGGEVWVLVDEKNPRVVIGDSSVSGKYGYLLWDSINDYIRLEHLGTNGIKLKDNCFVVGNLYPGEALVRIGAGWEEKFRIETNGNVCIGDVTATSKLQVPGLLIYADNAAAIAGGLTVGAFYRTGGDPDHVCVVH